MITGTLMFDVEVKTDNKDALVNGINQLLKQLPEVLSSDLVDEDVTDDKDESD